MSLTPDELEQCIDWMRLQSNSLSRSSSERAYYAMSAEWLTYWAATELFRRDSTVRDFIEDCLRTCDERGQTPGGKNPSAEAKLRKKALNGDPSSLAITTTLSSPNNGVN